MARTSPPPPPPRPEREGAAGLPAAVVCVHGLWMPGHEMALLRRRLRRSGYRTYPFSYASVRRTPADNARRLQDYVTRLAEPVVHFVGHSLGGLVIQHLFHLYPDLPPGRAVTLGTPHQGSLIARRMAAHGWGRRLLGRSIEAGVLGGAPPWPAQREVGVIAGGRNLGIGLLLPWLPRPCDGTVAVQETALEQAADRIVLPASHIDLIFQQEVVCQIRAFLETGRFLHGGAVTISPDSQTALRSASPSAVTRNHGRTQ